MEIAKNSFIMVFTVVVTLLLNYFFNIVLGWFLSTNEYGIYGASISLMMILSVFVTSGFPLTVAKILSEKISMTKKLRAFKTAVYGNFLIAVLISGLFLIVYSKLNFGWNECIEYLIVLYLLLSAVVACYRGALQGLFKFKKLSVANIFGTIVKLLCGVVLVIIGMGVSGVLLGILLGVFASLMLMVKCVGLNFLHIKGFEKRVFSFAIPMFIGILSITFIQNIDLITLKFITHSDTLAGYYQAAITIARLPYWIACAILSVAFSYISSEKRRIYADKLLKYVVMFLIFPSLFVAISPQSFIRLIYPERYMPASKALLFSVFALNFLTINQVLSSILQAANKPEIPAKLLSVGLIVQLIFLFVLIPAIGLIGAPISTLISMIICFFPLLRNYLKIFCSRLKIRDIIKFTAISLLSLMLFEVIPRCSVVFLILDFTFSMSIYLLLLWSSGLFDKKDTKMLFQIIYKKW